MAFSTFQLLFASPALNPVNQKAKSVPILNPLNRHGRIFLFSWLGHMVAFLSWYSFPPLLNMSIKKEIHLTQTDIGNSNIVALLATLMVRFISGPLCDRFGPRLVFVGILLVGSIPTAMAGLITSARGLIALRFFVGILGASFVPCQVWTTAFYDKNIIGTANALAAGWGNSGGGITYFVMPAVFDSLVNHTGLSPNKAWRVAYIVPFIIIIFVALGMLFTCDDTPNGKWSDRERSDSGRTVEINFESEILQVDNPSIITVSTAEKHPQQDSNIESQSDGQTYIDIAKSDNQARTNITNSEIIVPPSTKEMLQVVSSPATLTLAGLYACSFGTELAVNAILGSYYAQNFPSLGQTKSGQMAAMFGLLNVLSRPLSGIISDALYRRTQSVWAKKIWLISVGICGGALLVTIGALNPNREATMFGLVVCLAIFIQAASGANFSLAPHVYPAANGIVSGTIGSWGNLGGIIFSIIFRYNETRYDRSIWIIGVIVIIVNLSVFWIRPVPTVRN